MKIKLSRFFKIFLYSVAGLFLLMVIISILFPVDYYKSGIDSYNKKNYKSAYYWLSSVKKDDKNYLEAKKIMDEIKPILDSLEKVEIVEKTKNKKIKKEEPNKLSSDNTEKKNVPDEQKEKEKEESEVSSTSEQGKNIVKSKSKKVTEDNTSTVNKVNVGTLYELSGMIYKVEESRFKKYVGGDPLLIKRADGIFLIVKLSVQNKTKKQVIIDNSFFKLIDEDGNVYEYSPEATIAIELIGADTFFGMTCNPGITKKAKVIYELPSKDKKYQLILTDGYMSNQEVVVNLN